MIKDCTFSNGGHGISVSGAAHAFNNCRLASVHEKLLRAYPWNFSDEQIQAVLESPLRSVVIAMLREIGCKANNHTEE